MHLRRRRILDRLALARADGDALLRLCTVGAELTATTGAGIVLVTAGASLGSLGATDDVIAAIEDLQFTLGEGPSIDACTSDRPVLEPDLGASLVRRWPVFAPSALAAGARAVFSFPVRTGAAQLGALNLYRDRPGDLHEDHHADALVLADLAAEAILLQQARATPGQLAAELDAGGDFHFVVHQASGMVAVQLGTNVVEALVRLRAHAFANDLRLVDVARAVVDRTLRFGPPSDVTDVTP